MTTDSAIDIRQLLLSTRQEVLPDDLTIGSVLAASGLVPGPEEDVCITQGQYRNGTVDFLNWTLDERGDVSPEAWDRGAYTCGGIFRTGSVGGGSVKGRKFSNLTRVVYLAIDADLHSLLGLTDKYQKQELYDRPQAEIDEEMVRQWEILRNAYEQTGYPIHELTYTGHGLLIKTYLHPDDQHDLDRIKQLNVRMVAELNRAADLGGRTLIDQQCSDAGTRLHQIDRSLNSKPNGLPRPVRTLVPWDGRSCIRLPQAESDRSNLTRASYVISSTRRPVPETPHPLPIQDQCLIVGLMAGIWNLSGERHNVALHLSGLLRKQRVPRLQAEQIIRQICTLTGDEEVKDRLKAVATTYDSTGTAIAGYTRLASLLTNVERGPQILAALSDLLDANWEAAVTKATDATADRGEGRATSAIGEIAWALMSDVQERQVDWLWQRWLARGKLHVVAGVQGDGKSTLVNAVTAALSTGSLLPDGARSALFKVGYLVSEDGVEDTAVPRLRIHGADLGRHVWLKGFHVKDDELPLSLAAHMPYIEDFITDQQLDVLVIDAITDFLGSIKQNDNGEVRSILRPLVRLAVRTGCAVIGIAHLAKSGGGNRRAIERVLGSGAFTQVPRVVWAVSIDPDDEDKRYFGQIKNNIGKEPPTLAWHRDLDQPISWDGEAEVGVRAVMNGVAKRSSKRDEAKELLRSSLSSGPMPASEIELAAQEAGVSRSTLRQAMNELGVNTEKEKQFEGRWLWRLP